MVFPFSSTVSGLSAFHGPPSDRSITKSREAAFGVGCADRTTVQAVIQAGSPKDIRSLFMADFDLNHHAFAGRVRSIDRKNGIGRVIPGFRPSDFLDLDIPAHQRATCPQ